MRVLIPVRLSAMSACDICCSTFAASERNIWLCCNSNFWWSNGSNDANTAVFPYFSSTSETLAKATFISTAVSSLMKLTASMAVSRRTLLIASAGSSANFLSTTACIRVFKPRSSAIVESTSSKSAKDVILSFTMFIELMSSSSRNNHGASAGHMSEIRGKYRDGGYRPRIRLKCPKL